MEDSEGLYELLIVSLTEAAPEIAGKVRDEVQQGRLVDGAPDNDERLRRPGEWSGTGKTPRFLKDEKTTATYSGDVACSVPTPVRPV